MNQDPLWLSALKTLTSPLSDYHAHKPRNTPSHTARKFAYSVLSQRNDSDSKMGKSNKFDFTNRNNSGAKLGHIIGASLQKEAEKVKKDTEKQAHKVRKSSTGSSGSNGDTSAAKHIIDLKAPNKALGDEGVCALADGLQIALSNSYGGGVLALEDLNLSGNGMTTASLARMAGVIELSRYDLKTFDLSGNDIRVATDEGAEQWEAFLLSFKTCKVLRRLDLSNNAELGSRALEVLARVHFNEPPITPMPPGGERSVQSLPSEPDTDDKRQPQAHGPVSDSESITSHEPMANAQVLKRRCGLRSIPYITLNEAGLNNAGAMWLSYVVETHHYPSQLIDELNATAAETSITTYQQRTKSWGVDWTANKSLGKEGSQLLEKAEGVRRQNMVDDAATIASSNEFADSDSGLDSSDPNLVRPKERRSSRALPGNRRTSVRSINTVDGGEHEASELERARKKIQRQVIVHQGVSAVELWRSALAVFIVSRKMLCIAPIERKQYTGDPLFPMPSAHSPCSTSHQALTIQTPSSPGHTTPQAAEKLTEGSTNNSPTDRPTNDPTSPTSPTSHNPVNAKISYAKTLATSGELAITDVTNTPTTPLRLQKPGHRKGAFSEGADLPAVTDKLHALVVRDTSPGRFVRYQQRRIARVETAGGSFRDRSTACQLPMGVVESLLQLVVGRKRLDVMCEVQQRAAVGWGLKRETLGLEREWLRRDESAQVLTLLDGVGCARYGK